MSTRSVLVTGGAGYVGSVVIEELQARGYEVLAFDSMHAGHRAAVPPGVPLVVGDLTDPESLKAVFEARRFDAVMHMAGYTLVAESVADPGKYFFNNLGGGLNLLEAMRRHGVSCMVFSSSAGVYGEPDSVPIDEDAPCRPVNPYGQSKMMIEQMLDWYAHAYGLRFASLRYFNAAGATTRFGEDHRPESHIIPIVLQVALGKREQIPVFGLDYDTPDGSCVRDYAHVSDLAQAHVLALRRLEEGAAGVFNLGNGEGYSVLEVIECARRVTGHPIPVVPASRRPGDPAKLVATSKRAREALGWRPRYPELEAIVRSAWDWHQRHPDGYQE